jgi:hypothetical protein
MCAKPPFVNSKGAAMCDPTDPRLCGFHRAEDLQRDPDPPPGSWGWFWVGFAIVAGVLVVVWAL